MHRDQHGLEALFGGYMHDMAHFTRFAPREQPTPEQQAYQEFYSILSSVHGSLFGRGATLQRYFAKHDEDVEIAKFVNANKAVTGGSYAAQELPVTQAPVLSERLTMPIRDARALLQRAKEQQFTNLSSALDEYINVLENLNRMGSEEVEAQVELLKSLAELKGHCGQQDPGKNAGCRTAIYSLDGSRRTKLEDWRLGELSSQRESGLNEIIEASGAYLRMCDKCPFTYMLKPQAANENAEGEQQLSFL